MPIRRVIPDIYTEYLDGQLGTSAPALANVEAKIGAAQGGIPGQMYAFAGPTAKQDAKTVFKGGPLLRALHEAFDAGSSTIYAWRIGPATFAEVTLSSATPEPVLKLKARIPGSYWNGFDVQVVYPSSPPQAGEEPTIIIRDRNTNPETIRSFTDDSAADLVQQINDAALDLEASLLGPGQLAEVLIPVGLSGGDDGLIPSNGDYIAGLELTTGKGEVAWIHAVGAQSFALWSAILAHCAALLDEHNSERFAILETPQFTSVALPGSAQYLADLQTYFETVGAIIEQTADRNAVIFMGGAEFMDSEGNLYVGPITAACGGRMASLEVHHSLINKPVPNVLRLVPEFSPGQLQQILQARVNALRLKPGRGFIIAHSLTAAAPGSDYSRVNDLRAVYYGAKAAREAGQPYVGTENDSDGDGLRLLESAMSRPLEIMRDGGQIDGFSLIATSTPNDRLLGDVYVTLGIKPLRAMEIIYTTVLLR